MARVASLYLPNGNPVDSEPTDDAEWRSDVSALRACRKLHIFYLG